MVAKSRIVPRMSSFSAAWILHILYVFSLSVREKKLQRQIRDLKTLLEEREDTAAD